MVKTRNKAPWIPRMDRAVIEERFKCLRALVRCTDGLWVIKAPDLFEVSFTWEPDYQHEAPPLSPICTIITRHSWAYYGFFKPTIAEVIPFIPEELLPVMYGFEVIGPDTANDLNFSRHREAMEAGFHTAETTLYRLK